GRSPATAAGRSGLHPHHARRALEGGPGGGGGEHGIRLSGVALRAQGGRGRPPTLAGPAGLHLRTAAHAGAVHARWLGFCGGGAGRHAQARRCPRTAGADRDATVPAGRLLAADSRRRRCLPPVPPPLPLGQVPLSLRCEVTHSMLAGSSMAVALSLALPRLVRGVTHPPPPPDP